MLSTATHNSGPDTHETPFREAPGSTSAVFQSPALPAGSVDVTMFPSLSTATQSRGDEMHDTPVKDCCALSIGTSAPQVDGVSASAELALIRPELTQISATAISTRNAELAESAA
jgi:hypothetical protein